MLVLHPQFVAVMFEGLVELGERGLSEEEVKARNFRAKLLGLIYEDLLEVWFRDFMRYDRVKKDVRRGKYGDKRVAVDFILEKEGRLYVVEAKCWPAYHEGRLKKLTLNKIELVKREFRKFGTPFLEDDFVEKYRFEGKSVDGKILVWWDVEESEAERIKGELKVAELIPLKRILSELKWKPDNILTKYKGWVDQLFTALL
jgi:hypothetical protein